MTQTTTVLKLKHPVQWTDSETITELEIRRPRAGDLRVMKGKSPNADTLDLAAKLCGQPSAMIDRLDFEDTLELLDIVNGFLPSSPRTGVMPSED